MLKSQLISIKKEIVNSVGDTLTDLIQSSFKFPKKLLRSSMSRVGEYESMRPDLVSMRVYGTQDGWDLLLKYNAISNPFSISEGDLLYTVGYSELKGLITEPIEISERTEKKESNFEPIIPGANMDPGRRRNLEIKNTSLPPNLSSNPGSAVQAEGSNLVLGAGNTEGANVAESESLARTRSKSALLKNKFL